MLVDVAALQRENASLREQLAGLSTMSQAQSAQLVELRATNTLLVGQLAKLNDRVEELLAIAQRKQRKPAAISDKKPEPPPVVGLEAQQAFDARPAPPTLPTKPDKVKREPKRTGRNAVPAHLEVDDHLLRPAACERCGGIALDVVDEVVEEKLHVVKEHLRRRVVRLPVHPEAGSAKDAMLSPYRSAEAIAAGAIAAAARANTAGRN